jgi:glycosyltransferase involved in cell wall biosynthesis
VYTAAIARDVLDSGACEVRVVYRVPRSTPLHESLAKGLAKFSVPWRAISMLDFQYLKDLLWADVIHCHFPVIYATYPARLLGKKLIVTIEAKRKPQHGLRFLLGLKLAHAQWYISKFVAETWNARRFDEDCRIIPATSDLPSTHVPPASRRGFFFIARWIPEKGLEQLVEAYAKADIDHQVHPLFLYGDGPLRDEIERLVDHWKIRNHVTMPGFASAAEKEERMSSARWNVAPVTFPEDLGLTPIEARCCAVPSIVSRVGGLPEAAGEQALFCVPGNTESLRNCLEQAAGMSEEEYKSRSEQCRSSLPTYLPQPGFYYQEYLRYLKIQTSQSPIL